MVSKTASLRGSLAELLEQARQQTKTAGAHTEAGSVGGETSHPIKSLDDNASGYQEGSRSRENTTDLKKDQGPAGVESAPATTTEQEASQNTIGPLDAKSTGKDPASETDSVKGDKDDPGSEHPAKTDDGKKFGSVSEELRYLTQQSEKIGQAILTHILRDGQTAPKPATKTASPVQPAATQASVKAAEAGYDLAGLLSDLDVPMEDKMSCDRFVFEQSRRAVEAGVKRAEAYLEVAQGFFGRKQAEDEEGAPRADEQGSDEESSEEPGHESSEGEGGGGEGGGQPLGDEGMPSEEELLAMLAGGGGGGGGEGGGGGMAGEGGGELGGMLGGMGGEMGGMPGGMPGGEPGGMPGGAPGGMPGGGGEAIDPAMLMQILQSLGVDPSMLEQKAAAALKTNKQSAKDKNAGLRRRVASMILELVG